MLLYDAHITSGCVYLTSLAISENNEKSTFLVSALNFPNAEGEVGYFRCSDQKMYLNQHLEFKQQYRGKDRDFSFFINFQQNI